MVVLIGRISLLLTHTIRGKFTNIRLHETDVRTNFFYIKTLTCLDRQFCFERLIAMKRWLRWSGNISWVIGQAWSRDGCLLAKIFFCLRKKKKPIAISSHLDRTSLLNKWFIIWNKKKPTIFLRDTADNPKRACKIAPSCPLASQSQRNLAHSRR